jgi:hypothetical protein
VVGDTGFEPVTSIAQNEEKAEKIRGNLCRERIFQVIRISIFFDIFAYCSIFLTHFGHSLGTVA